MFAISLSSCSRYNANFKLYQSVFAIHDSPLYFDISILDFANAFLWWPRPGLRLQLIGTLALGLGGMVLRAVGSGIISLLIYRFKFCCSLNSVQDE
jgi:hypothetical protein